MSGDPTKDLADVRTWTTDALAGRLADLDEAYHRRANSPVPDAVYDRIKGELLRRDPKHPALAAVGAPVDGEPGDKVEHAQAMLSLDKCTTLDEFWAWYRGCLAGATDRANSPRLDDEARAWSQTPLGALVALPKIDGLACSLRYDAAGRLVRAATRGDGRIGEDVTANARKLSTVVQQLPANRFAGGLEVRGEIYLPLSRFAEVADTYANPRNLAAGTLKAKDNPAIDPGWLAFFAYDLLGAQLPTESSKLEALAGMGFAVPSWRRVCAPEAQAAFDGFDAARPADEFEADGIVLRLDDCGLAQRLGVTSHHPRGAIAWKYAASADTTTLQSVHWSVARTGTITPVALVAPVSLSGATVTRATLHNLSNLRRLGLAPGDVVEIVRRGGVIPHVERVVTPSAAPRCAPPTHCPSCGTATRVVARDDGKGGKAVEILMCGDPANCVTARQRSLLHYCQALELEGFGDKVVETLIDQGLCDNPADLYELTAEDLRPLPRFGEILVGNLLGQITRTRRVELPAFLVALGIAALGKSTAQLLASRGDLAAVRAMTLDDIAQLHSLGDKTAAAIVSGLRDKAGLVDALLRHVEVVQPAAAEMAGAGPMAGEVVVFTGALSSMGRRDAQQLVVRLGGIAGDSVTAETTLLVVGGDELDAAEPSSKLKKARKLQAAGGAIRIERADAFFFRVQGSP
ncbi:MAG: NAD-dependent DNA ligase LigA [Deltaproteobacteria bacterium]|nr:NAD-dependent DNA ligase LigA [Deltaproteobacteria bacterium]